MERALFLVYLSCLSLTSAFALTSTITVPLFLSLLCVVIFVINAIIYRDHYLSIEVEDLVLFLFLLSVYLGFFLNQNHFKSGKPFNHVIAYSYVVLINYYLIKNAYYHLCKKFGAGFISKSYAAIYFGIFITCAFGIAEFWLKNIKGIDVDSYIPRPAVSEYEPLALTDFIRLRSFVEESGHLAYYIEVFAPIAIYFSRKKKYLFYPLVAVISACFLLTFSTAGWLISAFTYLILTIWYAEFWKQRENTIVNYRKIFRYLLGVGIVVSIFASNYNLVTYVSSALKEVVVYKIGRSNSAEDRTARYLEGVNALAHSDLLRLSFGNGPAVYDTLQFHRGGTILLYLTIILESGLLGLSFFLIFCALLFYKAMKLQNPQLRFVLLFALCSSFLHFLIISNYWYPWFWILAIIIQANYRMDRINGQVRAYQLQNA
ncbi:O-antigen ligase family protein [Persicitalea jodogahamensis]|uniref:Uncharacterized protein n=1 Tax=Persicitalea jodogahamensis TaxID=402147 RepID=A0A8J3G8Y3_9BACT|nr:hypothetical protein [Persicitalea jodogahamensis]GHB59227.1 hypothetical protein GCM10007390_11110 [Persicitalea jodogahamensis]